MLKKFARAAVVLSMFTIVLGLSLYFQTKERNVAFGSDFSEDFEVAQVVSETNTPEKSLNQNWWVSSGAQVIFEDGVGRTIRGTIPESSSWRSAYARTAPVDTEGGYRPQNIFRMLTQRMWQEYTQQLYFKINAISTSSSSRRTAWNGVFLFNRLQDQDNLYYTGLRVDGHAVIKKKINGTYFTLAYVPVFEGAYHKTKTPSLIPLDTWIGMKAEVYDVSSTTASLALYMDIGRTGRWQLVASAQDNGTQYGGQAFLSAGRGGVRTDFMDVAFDEYSLTAR